MQKIKSRYLVLPSFLIDIAAQGVIDAADVLLLGTISALSTKDGYCTASNKYLSRPLNATGRTVQRRLNKLEKLGLLKKFVLRDKNNRVIERRLYVLFDIYPLKKAEEDGFTDTDNSENITLALSGGGDTSVTTPPDTSVTRSRHQCHVNNINNNINKYIYPNGYIEPGDKMSPGSYGDELINYFLDRLYKKLGYKVVSEQNRLRGRASNIVKLLTKYSKNGVKSGREFLKDDVKENIEWFLNDFVELLRFRKVTIQYIERVYAALKFWLENKGTFKPLYNDGVQPKRNHLEEIERTKEKLAAMERKNKVTELVKQASSNVTPKVAKAITLYKDIVGDIPRDIKLVTLLKQFDKFGLYKQLEAALETWQSKPTRNTYELIVLLNKIINDNSNDQQQTS